MKHSERENAISIGPDLWIEFGEMDVRSFTAVNIDIELGLCAQLWKALETVCKANCCGIDAFSLWEKDIQKAVGRVREDVVPALAEMIDRIESIRARVLVSERLNSYFPKPIFIELLNHIMTHAKCAG